VRPFAVIAGGGTGGHVQPALAVAGALVAMGHDPGTVHFVGSARGMEATLVPEAGYSITLLPGRGIRRGRSLDARLAAASAVVGLAAATARALGLLVRRRPAVVLAVGGYASLPCAVAAVALRVPLVLAEQNSVPGATNRLLGRFARAAAVAFPGTELPRAVVTGTPLRPEAESIDRSSEGRRRARSGLGLPDGRRVLGVAGGSLGSRRIHQAAVDLVGSWRPAGEVAVHHVVGARDFPEMGEAVDRAGGPADPAVWYRAVEYERRMPDLLAAADLMVCRAGGSTVAELAGAGVPAVLVPLPGAPGDHQTGNARVLSDVGAAVLLADAECDGGRLAGIVDGLLFEDARLAAMGRAAGQAGRPDAARLVAELVERCAAGGSRAVRGAPPP
jgi:UDP-N-acetylglucosamine--N-acetylmuramyl-(pentapeptide) pyrophosphoryl-undecaprenol N-acetylglucosamine transferase